MAVLLISIGCGGGSGNKQDQPSITSFTASPTTPIAVGANAALQAVFKGGDGIIQPGAIAVSSGVPVNVSPTINTTYTLQVTSRSSVVASATAAVVVEIVTATLGPSGGLIKSPAGVTVEIPFGALDQPTQLSVSATTLAPPAGIEAAGPVYRFEPSGTLFARPVKVSLPLPPGATAGTIYWSRLGTSDFSTFDSIGGTIAGGAIGVETPHFSLAVIGAATPTRTITGMGQTTWLSATLPRKSEPLDFANQGVEALVKDATGKLVAIPGVAGTGAQVGTFLIAGVPNGEYILHSGTQYLVTSTSSPDLGTQRGGRPARLRTPLTRAAPLNVTVDGLDSWQVDDQLEFYVSEEDDWDFFTESRTAVKTGDTGVSFVLDVSTLNGSPLQRSTIHAQGDHALIAQLSSHSPASGPRYVAMSRIAQLPAFDLPEGGAAVPVSATMSDVSASNTLTVDYRGALWESALADGNPNQKPFCVGVGCTSFFGVVAQAGSAIDGSFASSADLLLIFDFTGDAIVGPFTYGSPSSLGGVWGSLFRVSRIDGVFPTPLAGTTGLRRGLRSFASWTTTADIVQGTAQTARIPVAPPVSMPLAPTVNGGSFFADTTGIGLTPTISWSAPRTGVPDFYSLAVLQLGATGTVMTATPVAQIITPGLSFTLPSSILQASTPYVFTLTAAASTSPGTAASLAAAPFRFATDVASAGTVSGTFTP